MTATLTRLLRPDGLPIDFDPDIDAPLVGPSVLALVGPSSPACNMWRVWQPFASLQVRGYRAEWAWLTDARSADAMPFFDAYVFCRSMWERKDWAGAKGWLAKLRRGGKKIFYEADDDLFSEFMVDQQIKGIASESTKERLREEAACQRWAMQQCDGVTVSTQRLATTVRALTDKPVEVVPNAIDAEWFQAVQKLGTRTTKGVTIGWAGGHRPDSDVTEMAIAWGRIAKRYPEVTFLLMGYQSDAVWSRVPHGRIKGVPWMHQSEYPMALVDVDIGCCPLENKPFNRNKTPIKAWEYALSGAAVVASPAVYRQVIDPGRSGTLVETADEWEAALAGYVEDAALRRKHAAALKADVLNKWSLRKNFRRWPDAWHRLWAGAA